MKKNKQTMRGVVFFVLCALLAVICTANAEDLNLTPSTLEATWGPVLDNNGTPDWRFSITNVNADALTFECAVISTNDNNCTGTFTMDVDGYVDQVFIASSDGISAWNGARVGMFLFLSAGESYVPGSPYYTLVRK